MIAISESAKTDIVRFLDVPAERIDVTYPGPALRTEASVAEATLRRDLDLGDGPIVLTVSAKRPHKNLERLFEAFVRVRVDQFRCWSCRVTKRSTRKRCMSTSTSLARREDPLRRLAQRQRARRACTGPPRASFSRL